jgi:hypothetical protein
MGSGAVTHPPALTDRQRGALTGLAACAGGVRPWLGSDYFAPADMRALAALGLVRPSPRDAERFVITDAGRGALR